MTNESNKNKFRVGDRVFAKLRGYPYWPAVIDTIELKNKICKYNVIFYGTNEAGLSIKEIDICSFLENKNNYGSSKVVVRVRNISVRQGFLCYSALFSS